MTEMLTWVSTARVAQRLRVTTQQARKMIQGGIIPGGIVNGYWYADGGKWDEFMSKWKESVSAEQAAKLLGLKKTVFFHRLREGLIKVESFPINAKSRRYMLKDLRASELKQTELFKPKPAGVKLAHLSVREMASRLDISPSLVHYMLQREYISTNPQQFANFERMWNQTVPANVACLALNVDRAELRETARMLGVKTMKVGRSIRYWKQDLLKEGRDRAALVERKQVTAPEPQIPIQVVLGGLPTLPVSGVKVYKEGEEVVMEVEFKQNGKEYTLIRRGGHIKVTAE